MLRGGGGRYGPGQSWIPCTVCKGSEGVCAVRFSGLVPGKMATEGDPAALVKVLHLMILSFSWGMQLWMTFIAGFVLIQGVSRHTFGLVQSKLFPFYFYSVLGCAFLNLSIYATYHPRELLSPSESLQIVLFFLCLVLSAVNAQWLSQSTNKAMLKMQEIEREHGLGDEVGRKEKRDAYKTLQEKDPKYKALRHKFFRYHGISSLCNLICVVCNGVNLAYAGLQLSEL